MKIPPKIHTKFAATNRRRRGVTVVETAIVMLPLLMFIMGILEYSRILMVRNLADNACREGARFAVVNTYNKTTTDVQNVVFNMLAGQANNFYDSTGGTFTASDVSVYMSDPTTGANLGAWTNAQFGQAITVQIQGNFIMAVPKLINAGATMPFTAQATMLSEAN